MKKFEVEHGGNAILVENRASGEKLFVNGELQDERVGLSFVARLYGKLPTGESIKVSLGGVWTIQCRIFIDNKLVFPKK